MHMAIGDSQNVSYINLWSVKGNDMEGVKRHSSALFLPVLHAADT